MASKCSEDRHRIKIADNRDLLNPWPSPRGPPRILARAQLRPHQGAVPVKAALERLHMMHGDAYHSL